MKKPFFVLLVCILFVNLASCTNLGATPAPVQPSPIPTVIVDKSPFAEGRIVPKEDLSLSFLSAGQVAEVLVSEGELVERGQVLARLGNRAEIESNLANIQVELLAAEQARQALFDNLSLQRAELARQISAANLRLRDAQYALDNWTVPANQRDLPPMQAVAVMQAALDQARRAFELVKSRPAGDSLRQQNKENLDRAQSDYNAALRYLELTSAAEEAQTQLDKLVENYKLLENGPNPNDLATTEARLAAAQAAHKSAEAALERLELKAAIDGTLVEQNLLVGQSVAAGTPVMRIVDFSAMYVETEDLTELAIVDIHLGQKVRVRADALRAVELTGSVARISDVYEEKRGDITYTVRILLDGFDPRLRWGMTVEVFFE